MTQSETVIAAAAVGAVGVLLSALIAGGVALRSENRRRLAAQREAHAQAVRTQAAEVFRCMFVVQHELEWLTWHAAKRPNAVTSDLTASYEAAIHAGYPRLLGAMAVLASIDIGTYNDIVPLVEQIYAAEATLAVLITGLADPTSRSGSLDGLSGRFQSVSQLYRELPPRMAAVMRRAQG